MSLVWDAATLVVAGVPIRVRRVSARLRYLLSGGIDRLIITPHSDHQESIETYPYRRHGFSMICLLDWDRDRG